MNTNWCEVKNIVYDVLAGCKGKQNKQSLDKPRIFGVN